MDQLSDAHLDWTASFLSLPKDALATGQAVKPAQQNGAANGTLPAPMPPDCKTVHGKVPGPENHLLCVTHNHVVDVEAKTIIAHSLAEYMKTHPDHGKGHAGHDHTSSAAKAPAGATAAPASAAAKTDATPPEVPRTKIPVFTGSAKEVFAQECALLDTFRPSKDHPDMYTAVVDGKEASIAKAQAEAILAQVSKQMESTIGAIQDYNDSLIKTYEAASAKGLEHIGSGLNKLVSFAKGDGWIHDPGDALNDLKGEGLAALTIARFCVAGRQFQTAALKIADADIRGGQMEHLFTAFENKVQKNADTTLSVLRHVESASKFVSKTIATAEFGPAGAAAIDAAFAGGEVTGEALAGHDIDWTGRFIDLGMEVLMDKFGDKAEAAIKDRVKGLVEDRLKSLGKEKAKELAEKIAEKVAKKAVEKGSDLVKDELHAVAEKVKNTKMNYADLAKQTVDAMRQPNAETTGKLETAIENDPEFAKFAAVHPK